MGPVVEGVLGLDVGSVGVSLFGEVTEVLGSAGGSFASSPFLPKTPVAKRIPTTAPDRHEGGDRPRPRAASPSRPFGLERIRSIAVRGFRRMSRHSPHALVGLLSAPRAGYARRSIEGASALLRQLFRLLRVPIRTPLPGFSVEAPCQAAGNRFHSRSCSHVPFPFLFHVGRRPSHVSRRLTLRYFTNIPVFTSNCGPSSAEYSSQPPLKLFGTRR